MIIDKIEIRKIVPKEGYLLTDGQTTSTEVYLGVVDSPEAWWEIPDPEYFPEDNGTYLHPYLYQEGVSVKEGFWYYDENVGKDLPHEAIVNGTPSGFYDPVFFDFVD